MCRPERLRPMSRPAKILMTYLGVVLMMAILALLVFYQLNHV